MPQVCPKWREGGGVNANFGQYQMKDTFLMSLREAFLKNLKRNKLNHIKIYIEAIPPPLFWGSHRALFCVNCNIWQNVTIQCKILYC